MFLIYAYLYYTQLSEHCRIVTDGSVFMADDRGKGEVGSLWLQSPSLAIGGQMVFRLINPVIKHRATIMGGSTKPSRCRQDSRAPACRRWRISGSAPRCRPQGSPKPTRNTTSSRNVARYETVQTEENAPRRDVGCGRGTKAGSVRLRPDGVSRVLRPLNYWISMDFYQC